MKVAFTDIDGVLRGKYLHRDKFFSAVEAAAASASATWCSAGTCGDQCYDNAKLTGWQHGFPDALARLDLDTYRHVPWDGDVPSSSAISSTPTASRRRSARARR